MVVVKTEDEACGGPLRFYPLRPDELIDAGNRTKVLDVIVTPAINCESHVHKYELFTLRNCCRQHLFQIELKSIFKMIHS